jgi:hypothetical protein
MLSVSGEDKGARSPERERGGDDSARGDLPTADQTLDVDLDDGDDDDKENREYESTAVSTSHLILDWGRAQRARPATAPVRLSGDVSPGDSDVFGHVHEIQINTWMTSASGTRDAGPLGFIYEIYEIEENRQLGECSEGRKHVVAYV